MRENYNLKEVSGFAHIFVLHAEKSGPAFIMAKVIDDFLLAGTPIEIDKFHEAISKRIKVGTYCLDAMF